MFLIAQSQILTKSFKLRQTMASLVSTFSKQVDSLPENYIMPPEQRPENFTIVCKSIPVIDLGNAGGQSRLVLVQQIMKASKEYGIFQVINHGVSEKRMQDAMSLFKEFFDMSVEDKANCNSEEGGTNCLVTTGRRISAKQEYFQYWRETIHHPVHPQDHRCLPQDHQPMASWPEKPKRYREVVEPYSLEVRKLGLQILDLIREGLGLKPGVLGEDGRIEQFLRVNHYPPLPTMGINGHTDLGLITLIQQDVYGLQTCIGGKWVGLEPLPNAFVVQMCDQMEIISNGKLKGAEHRGVTNSSIARTSIGSFFSPPHSAIIEPAKELVTDDNPPLFKSFTFGEYLMNYYEHATKVWTGERILDCFKL